MAQDTIETTPSLSDLIQFRSTNLWRPSNVHDAPSSPKILHRNTQRIQSTRCIKHAMAIFRLLFPSIATLSIKDIHLGKYSSTTLLTISQKGKECMMGFMNLTNLSHTQGYSFPVPQTLHPSPPPACIPDLTTNTSPHWISYQTPYHPSSLRRVHSYPKFFVPLSPQPPSLRDQWLTPTHPFTRFTNETLSFLLDISFPILDNFYPEKASGGQAATVQVGLAQKREREMGVAKNVDVESGSYRAPAMITSLATSIEIKKLLPPGGSKWLFMRAQAKEIKDGRLSMEVMVFDEGMELVALSRQLCPIIELSRAMANKQKL
ncbi:uncharacterized protein EAE97_000242 [Botrytis byssoidea]|uniref:Acyl-CoA thioesterase-like C-terminal domain-containing protein n=1 Tax=Botrytis byssoidea TaxID=139641 RepID=A0A9P5J011_9HELO|nr:uncharacterized protein EAE97_000242 [Botrytis byssoidea]KAF7954983.1 hypothetical protein EAE97_000242 [Botrytis byssoidea]